MPYHDNPAGRLHDLLSRLSDQNPKASLLSAWAQVLGVQQNDVVLHLGAIADLLREIQGTVDSSGEDALAGPVKRYRNAWAKPIFPRDQPFKGPLMDVLPGDVALEALGLVSAQLHLVAPDGLVPDADQLAEVGARLREVLGAVLDADDIPDKVKRLIVDRLHEVEEAIEHLDVGGPRAVQRAIEAVMGSVIFTPDTEVVKSQTVNKVWATLATIWTVFAAGPAIQGSIEAWRDILPVLEAPASVSNGDPASDAATGDTR